MSAVVDFFKLPCQSWNDVLEYLCIYAFRVKSGFCPLFRFIFLSAPSEHEKRQFQLLAVDSWCRTAVPRQPVLRQSSVERCV